MECFSKAFQNSVVVSKPPFFEESHTKTREIAYLGPRGAQERPWEVPGGPNRPQEAPGGPGRGLEEALRGPRTV